MLSLRVIFKNLYTGVYNFFTVVLRKKFIKGENVLKLTMNLTAILLRNKEFRDRTEEQAQKEFLKLFGAYHSWRGFSTAFAIAGVEEFANKRTPKLPLETIAERLVRSGLASEIDALEQAEYAVRLRFNYKGFSYRFKKFDHLEPIKVTYRLEGEDVTYDSGAS